MIDNIVLWVFVIAIIANIYTLFRFWQAMRRFTQSQLELNAMLKRHGFGVDDQPPKENWNEPARHADHGLDRPR